MAGGVSGGERDDDGGWTGAGEASSMGTSRAISACSDFSSSWGVGVDIWVGGVWPCGASARGAGRVVKGSKWTME